MRPRAAAKDVRQRAIGLLARREHSRAELARKLAPHGSAEEIASVLASLEQQGLLSDARACAAWVRSHAERVGNARLRQTLRDKGIAAELIEERLAQDDLPAETERARAVWAKKFGAAPTDAREWARQARFLQSRGFPAEVIRRLLRAPTENDA